jgi:hypothetical protein
LPLCELSPPVLKGLCEGFLNKGINEVTATAELAGTIGINETNFVDETGTALTLPLKVKLSNPFLGETCYIGSNSHPVTLNLTTGLTNPPPPNKPIEGSAGEINVIEELLTAEKVSLVDNAFSAPGSEGCGGILSFLVDPVVNAKVGLPAAAGNNTAIQNGTLKQAGADVVKAHE